MTDRAVEPLGRRREPGNVSKPSLLAETKPERRLLAARGAAAGEPRRAAVPASASHALLALLEPLPSDYYLG